VAARPGAGQGSPTSVAYRAWNESIRADLHHRTLLHTRTEHTYDNPVSANPSGSREVMVVDRALSIREVFGILRVVRRSGFLELGDSYGAPEGERFYPYRLEVEFSEGPAKGVLHRSNPAYPEEPAPFKALVEHLRGLSTGTPDR
jgi:hypothetical protein